MTTAAPRPVAASWLAPAAIRLDAHLAGRAEVLGLLADLLAPRVGESTGTILAALRHRESLGSTALGQGVALPHARIDGLDVPAAAFVRLRSPLELGAPDGRPVLFVLGLLLPASSPQRQLRLLADVATHFSDFEFRARMARAHDVDAAWRLLDPIAAGGVEAPRASIRQGPGRRDAAP